jgi:hypothetical protein
VGYRIDFRVGGGVLQAIVHGRSAQHLLIDIRRLHDRLGRPRRPGCELRRFEDHDSALLWLRSPK